jgi:hypothetical protein
VPPLEVIDLASSDDEQGEAGVGGNTGQESPPPGTGASGEGAREGAHPPPPAGEEASAAAEAPGGGGDPCPGAVQSSRATRHSEHGHALYLAATGKWQAHRKAGAAPGRRDGKGASTYMRVFATAAEALQALGTESEQHRQAGREAAGEQSAPVAAKRPAEGDGLSPEVADEVTSNAANGDGKRQKVEPSADGIPTTVAEPPGPVLDEACIMQLTEMGIERERAEEALRHSGNDVAGAIADIFKFSCSATTATPDSDHGHA